MKIYTKTGDAGDTSLYKGGRVGKDSPRLMAYGTLDELNSLLGLALAQLPAAPWVEAVAVEGRKVQRDLFALGAELATRAAEKPAWHVVEADVEALERAIDRMDAELPPLRTFILPGGHPAGAALHVARCVARRAEREVVALMREEPVDALNLRYLNRLSDYLFVLARHVNARAGTPEPVLEM